MHLATSLGIDVEPPRPLVAERDRAVPGARHHVVVAIDRGALGPWSWSRAKACDRRSFLRGVMLGAGSLSFTASGPHVEIVLSAPDDARAILDGLSELDIRALSTERRARQLVYLKGHEEIAALFRLVGANRGLLELETHRVGREVQSRLNRLINAEGANLARTVAAADRQLAAIGRLEASGRLPGLRAPLREAAAMRRRMPDADLDTLAVALGVSRSAVNHRLRRLVELATDEEE